MNIAITQRTTEINGFTYDCLGKEWYVFLHDHNIIPIPNWCREVDLSNVDMLILSGGNNSSDRKRTETNAVNYCIQNETN